jgi:exodeoxyribonuclease VII large subunit
VIVVARGGGSVEDLLPFSDEALIRAVHAMPHPVVSAIGHEPDQPLLDLVADVRASTPTDAAKLVVPDVAEELRIVERRPRPAPAALPAGSAASRPARRAARPPGLADPRPLLDAAADEVEPAARPARRTPATGSTGPPTRSPTSAPGPGALAAGHAAARVRRAPGRRRPRASPRSPASREGRRLVRVADGRVHATRSPTTEETDG